MSYQNLENKLHLLLWVVLEVKVYILPIDLIYHSLMEYVFHRENHYIPLMFHSKLRSIKYVNENLVDLNDTKKKKLSLVNDFK